MIKPQNTFSNSMKFDQNTSHMADSGKGFECREKGRILGRLPEWTRESGQMELKNIVKMNRFLRWQETRILRALSIHENDKAILIWNLLLKESFAYQLVLFHRSQPNWYWNRDQLEVRKQLEEAVNDLRRCNLEILVKRFYIKKANGKLRPIGAPTLKSKMIGKAYADMLNALGASDLDHQHGFSTNRGIHTAIPRMWANYGVGRTKIYEFDLRSWFNKVRPTWVIKAINEKSKKLGDLFSQLIYNTRIEFSHLEEEMELRFLGIRKKNWVISRNGMTQGMPYSPQAANLALDIVAKKPEGLVLYADDGLLMMKSEEDTNWLKSIILAGAELAYEKSGWVKGPFTFLGVEVNFEKKQFRYQDSYFTWEKYDVNTLNSLVQWLKRVPSYYSNIKVGWHWWTKTDAYIRVLNSDLTTTESLKVYWNSLWNASSTNGYRYMWGLGIVDIQSSSSRCLELLTRDRPLIRKARLGTYTPIKLNKLEKYRKDYIEILPYEYAVNSLPNFVQERLRIRSVRDYDIISE